MGLLKTIKTNVGVDASYWIISKIDKDKINKTSFLVLYGYPSKEVRNSGATFLDRRFINIYPKDYDSVFGLQYLNKEGVNDYQRVYEFIKYNFEEFTDALDDLSPTPQNKLNMATPPLEIEECNYYELAEAETYE